MSHEEEEIEAWLNEADEIPSDSESEKGEEEGEPENVVGEFLVAEDGSLQQVDYLDLAQENSSVSIDFPACDEGTEIIPTDQFLHELVIDSNNYLEPIINTIMVADDDAAHNRPNNVALDFDPYPPPNMNDIDVLTNEIPAMVVENYVQLDENPTQPNVNVDIAPIENNLVVEDEDDEPLAKRLYQIEVKWYKKYYSLNQADNFSQETGTLVETDTPLASFSALFPEDLISLLVDQTNLYATQNANGPIRYPSNSKEMKVFLGLNIMMGIKKTSIL